MPTTAINSTAALDAKICRIIDETQAEVATCAGRPLTTTETAIARFAAINAIRKAAQILLFLPLAFAAPAWQTPPAFPPPPQLNFYHFDTSQIPPVVVLNPSLDWRQPTVNITCDPYGNCSYYNSYQPTE